MGAVAAHCDSVLVRTSRLQEPTEMTIARRLRSAVSGLVAEDRTGFKRIDASPARYDDGSWLKR